jgi:hypothetical protein
MGDAGRPWAIGNDAPGKKANDSAHYGGDENDIENHNSDHQTSLSTGTIGLL